jgi:hypothetical protein
MKKTLFAMTVGAGLMYLFHPEHGGPRRARLRDTLRSRFPQTRDAVHDKADAVIAKAEDLNARADSLAAEAIASVGPGVAGMPSTLHADVELPDLPAERSTL